MSGFNKQHKNYTTISNDEKQRAQGFVRIKEYPHYYLYAKIKDDKVLYRECFSKFDINGVKSVKEKYQRPGGHYSRW